MIALLREVREQAAGSCTDDDFAARQNAEAVAGAERYYRTMARGGPESWNVRDTHMVETLDRISRHLADTAGPAKVVVWEHNTHVGDARATDMAAHGLVNVGQLVRERYGPDEAVLVGFGTYEGTVVAGAEWGAPMRVMRVPPAWPGSLEALLHDAGLDAALFVHPPRAERPAWLRETVDHRAIGVVYDPALEAWGNYVPTILGERYDAFLWLDRTSAVRPLHVTSSGREMESYPSGV